MKETRVKCVGLNEDGLAIVVPKVKSVLRMLPSEEATIRTEGKESEIVTIHTPSMDRKESKCPYFDECGGCVFHHMTLSAMKSWKERVVKDAFSFVRLPVYPIIECADPYHYRSKNQMVVFKNKKKQPTLGMYKPNSHLPTLVSDCIIQEKKSNEVFKSVQLLLRDFKLEPFDEDKGTGVIRHVLVKEGYSTGQIMVVLVLVDSDFPGRKVFVNKLIAMHPEVKTVVIDHNIRSNSAILSNKQKVVYGKGFIEDRLLGLSFKISPSSFFQVNPKQTEILYQKAIEVAKLKPTDVVLDVYSGTGTIGILMSKSVKEVICVENNRFAVADAKDNVKYNQIKNVDLVQADATEFITNNPRLNVDVLVMDPPRSGATPQFLNAVKLMKPKRIVYISCEPATQGRDVKELLSDYQIQLIQPVDMFPFTRHVESIILMTYCGSEEK